MSDSSHPAVSELARLLGVPPSVADSADRAETIYRDLRSQRPRLRPGNFSSLSAADVEAAVTGYDDVYFRGAVRRALGESPLTFRVSSRMTSSGGTTTRRQRRSSTGELGVARYEIAVSSTLLLNSFQGEAAAEPLVLSGIPCVDRVQGLQRVVEHELVHLIELLVWGKSNCRGGRYQGVAESWFRHTEHSHRLVTPRERAATEFGIRVGSLVSFAHQGRRYEGRVNRVTRRATVLVEDPNGEPYSNGRSYSKFYVPLEALEPLG